MNDCPVWRAVLHERDVTSGVGHIEVDVATPVVAQGEMRHRFPKFSHAMAVVRLVGSGPARDSVGEPPAAFVVNPAACIDIAATRDAKCQRRVESFLRDSTTLAEAPEAEIDAPSTEKTVVGKPYSCDYGTNRTGSDPRPHRGLIDEGFHLAAMRAAHPIAHRAKPRDSVTCGAALRSARHSTSVHYFEDGRWRVGAEHVATEQAVAIQIDADDEHVRRAASHAVAHRARIHDLSAAGCP